MDASDETMQSAWWTRARRLAQDPAADAPTESLQELALREFAVATKAANIRAQIDVEWSRQPELVERAQAAIGAARGSD